MRKRISIWHPNLNQAASLLRLVRFDLRKALTFVAYPTAQQLEYQQAAIFFLQPFGVELTVE